MLKYLNPAYYLRTAQRSGYTIDQTILIVVIIAILITLVIVTIGWNLINRTTGTRLGSQLTQVGDAITQFYGRHRVFPHQATATGTAPNLNVGAGLTTTNLPFLLTGPTGPNFPTALGAWVPSITQSTLVNHIDGFTIGAGQVTTGYGTALLMANAAVANWTGAPAPQQYMVIGMTSVPVADAQEADRTIDGTPNANSGRLVYTTAACMPAIGGAVSALSAAAPTTGSVNVCYVAAALQ